MQKPFFVLPAALALLLCGCKPPANTAVDARELKKAQQIEEMCIRDSAAPAHDGVPVGRAA